MAETAKGKSAGSKGTSSRRFLRAKLVALGVVGLAGFVAFEAGYAGWAWSHLTSHVYARDEGLLQWFPPRTTAILIIDPHLGDASGLGAPVREGLQRLRDDVKKTMGIDLGLDVDKAVLSPNLVVARGRFNGKKIADRLVELHYLAEEHGGLTYFVRAGEDAIAIVEDSVLVYGDEASMKAAIDAKDTDQSLAKDERVLQRLKSVGWDRAALATLRINDDKPSVRDVLAGSSGPRAVTLGLGTKGGLELAGRIETASPTAAQEMKKTLEERAKSPVAVPALGQGLSDALGDLGKKASISITEGSSEVVFVVRLDTELLERLEKSAGTAPGFADATKDATLLRLFGH